MITSETTWFFRRLASRLRGKRTTFGSVTSRNTGIERSEVFVQMFVRSCGQWTEPLTKRVNKNVVAKGTVDDNVNTHRKMRHTQRQGSRTIDLIRRAYGRICRDQKSGGVFRYASRILASSRSMREAGVAELQNQNREFKGYPRRARKLMVTINICPS